MITSSQLLKFSPNSVKFLDGINQTCAKYDIDSKLRQAHFLAQIAHESGDFTHLIENLNYSKAERIATIFRSGFDLDKDKKVDPEEIKFAEAYVNNPQKLGSRAYANRMGNGPESSGDGYKYRGRGLIQVTGKDNYAACSLALFHDQLTLLNHPEMIEQPLYAVLSAGWFWNSRNLNVLADKDDLLNITLKINGGTHGLDDHDRSDTDTRMDWLVKAKNALA